MSPPVSTLAKRCGADQAVRPPVSGGVLGSKNGTLGVYLGCEEIDQNLPRLQGLLSRVGSNMIPCGSPSLGVVSKLVNNNLSGTIGIATAEVMNMGMRAGVDARVLANVISVVTGKNEIADKFNPSPGIVSTAPASRGYKGGFTVELMHNDYKLATDLAASVGARLLLGQTGLSAYKAASEHPECVGWTQRLSIDTWGEWKTGTRSLEMVELSKPHGSREIDEYSR